VCQKVLSGWRKDSCSSFLDGKELQLLMTEKTLVSFLKAGNGRGLMRANELELCMEDLTFLVMSAIHWKKNQVWMYGNGDEWCVHRNLG
jgi:hypothetical protein